MPVSTVIVLVGVVAMFAIFACALAWAQLQTRHLADNGASAPANDRMQRRPF